MMSTSDRPYMSPGRAAHQRWRDEQQTEQAPDLADWTDYNAYYGELTRAEQTAAWTGLSPEQQTDYQAWLDAQAVPAPPVVPAPLPATPTPTQSAPVEPVQAQAPQRQLNVGNAFSLRVVWAAGWAGILIGGGAAYLLSLIAAPLGYSAYVLVPLVFLITIYVFMASPPVTCPQCFKQIKMGAARCHHCGATYG